MKKSARKAHAEIFKIFEDNKLFGLFMVSDKSQGAWKACFARQWIGSFVDEDDPRVLRVWKESMPIFLPIALSVREFLSENLRLIDEIIDAAKADGVEIPDAPIKFSDNDPIH